MSARNSIQANKSKFLLFLKEKEQKNELVVLASFYVLAFIAMINIYEFPTGTADSTAYIQSAILGEFTFYRPYGYSYFLRLIHNFSSSLMGVVFVQSVLNAVATLLFLFVLKFFYQPKSKSIYYSIVFLIVISPSALYLTNTILADSIFTSLTILWVTCCIWFINSIDSKTKIILLGLKIIIIYLTVNIRHTGMIYFGIELMLLMLMLYLKQSRSVTLTGMVVLILVGVQFYQKQLDIHEKTFGIRTFSGFSGWQLASNALHVLPYIELDPKKINRKSFRDFALYAKSADTLFIRNDGRSGLYMWEKEWPLKQYLFYEMHVKKTPYLYSWIKLGSIEYPEFSKFIQSNYPVKYFLHFILPNAVTVFYPQSGYLGFFLNNWLTDLGQKEWYRLPPDQILNAKYDLMKIISGVLVRYKFLIWIIFFPTIVMFLVSKEWKKLSLVQNISFLFIVTFILGYVAFHIYVAPTEIRYVEPYHASLLAVVFIFLNTRLTKYTSP